MKPILYLLTALLVPFASQANEVPFLVCQQSAIEQALAFSRSVIQGNHYKIEPRETLRSSFLNINLMMIEAIEKSIFLKKVFNLGPDILPGAVMRDQPDRNDIAIFPATVKALNELAQDSRGAHMFVMAHEIAHMVQNQWQAKDPKGLSPHQLSKWSEDGDEFSIMHAETDCIGVEIMRKTGQTDFTQVVPALEITAKECENFRTKEFCERGNKIRIQSVEKYLNSFR